MKIVKIKIIKILEGVVCKNLYPDGYRADSINVVAYSEKKLGQGSNYGYLIATIRDDFPAFAECEEITKDDAFSFLAECGLDKNLDEETYDKFCKTRQASILTALNS